VPSRHEKSGAGQELLGGQVCDLLLSQGAWMPRRHEKSGAGQELTSGLLEA
jgi:hypothetical protein